MIKLNNQQIDALTNKIVRNLQEENEQKLNIQERLNTIWAAWENSKDIEVFKKYNLTPSSFSIINLYDPELNKEIVSTYIIGRPEYDDKLFTFNNTFYKIKDKNYNIKNIIKEDIILYSIDMETIEDLIITLTNKYK